MTSSFHSQQPRREWCSAGIVSTVEVDVPPVQRGTQWLPLSSSQRQARVVFRPFRLESEVSLFSCKYCTIVASQPPRIHSQPSMKAEWPYRLGALGLMSFQSSNSLTIPSYPHLSSNQERCLTYFSRILGLTTFPSNSSFATLSYYVPAACESGVQLCRFSLSGLMSSRSSSSFTISHVSSQ